MPETLTHRDDVSSISSRTSEGCGFGSHSYETERESGIIITKSTTSTGYAVFQSSHMLNLKAAWFSAQSHLAASSCRRPRPTRLLSSGGPGCCSCSHGAPGAPYAPAGRAAAGRPSPAVGLLPGSHSAPPQTLPAGLGSPAWLLSAVTTGRRFTDEKLRHGNLDFTLFSQISANIVRFRWTFKHEHVHIIDDQRKFF